MIHALLFELTGIQSYLFASGRLRDVIGASEMLDRLTNHQVEGNLLDAVCTQTPGSDGIVFSRRAGGAFYAFCEQREPLEFFMALWTLAVQHWTPGMSYNIALGQGDDHLGAFNDAREQMRADQSHPHPRLPAAAPLAERNRRTGQVAEASHRNDGLIDAATARKKVFADLSQGGFIQRFSPPEAQLSWRDWPTNMEPAEPHSHSDYTFPFQGDDRTVALVHADGNGVGQVLLTINKTLREQPQHFLQVYRSFSRLIEESTIEAAWEATRRVLIPAREKEQTATLAARPILLGGEDVIVIVRADLALDYIEVFAGQFEEESRKRLATMEPFDIPNLPQRLTLGLGAVFLRASQPFYMGIMLAEELMAEGKKAAKVRQPEDPPATFQFQHITASLVDDYNTLIERQYTHRYDDAIYVDSLGTYFLDGSAPCLSKLRELADLLSESEMSRGPTRQLLTLIGLAPVEAKARYRRWRQLMKENHPQLLRSFDQLLAALLVTEHVPDDLPYGSANAEGVRASPLGDVLGLMGAATKYPAAGNSHHDKENAG